MQKPTLVLACESEASCRERLAGEFRDPQVVLELSSYLAQSTDIAHEFDAITQACAARGIDFLPVELNDLIPVLSKLEPSQTLVWPLTDGFAFYRGSSIPVIARHMGFDVFGSQADAYAICQDKFRSGAIMRAAGLPSPPSGLLWAGVASVEPPPSSTGWFVKPNLLGAKVGIWPDSRCHTLDQAKALSKRIYDRYFTEALVQAYVPGRNVRVSFLRAGQIGARLMPTRLGVYFVDSASDFQTMTDSMALYGETGDAAKSGGDYREPELEPVARTQPEADRRIRDIVRKLHDVMGLDSVFSVDLRVEPDDTVHILEFEVCPGLPCFDFRAYLRMQYGLSLPEAMALAASDHFFDDRPYVDT